LKATDYRIDMGQMLSLRAMKTFLENLKPKNAYICFTHCDMMNNEGEEVIDEVFIKSKLASFKKYGKIDIPFENVVLFDKTIESLEEFVGEIERGNVKIAEDIEDLVENFEEDLPSMVS
jgi:hypothetical protein